ncbi:hypothetical protein [Tenacibaculum aestuariivivum]|uniref:hypothetical protein n=1 Tax=Tenacibaculum aestuariivivum TaxID=2006131 RepID=UPI003AB27D82
MNLLAIHITCWLIPLLVGLICALLGYLLGRLFRKQNNNEEILVLKNKINKLQVDLKACNDDKLQLKSAEAQNLNTVSSFTNVKTSEKEVALISFNALLAKEIFGKKVKENDLKIVEGIGPKIESLFHIFGIKTWKDLSETSVEKCQEVLKSGGDRYKMHKPATWPKQAKLAYEGKWKELLKWQDELDGGKQ